MTIVNPTFVYTGSFNPVHFGQLQVALECQSNPEVLGYSGSARILFVPAARSIFGKPPFSLEHRVKMLLLGITGLPGMQVLNLDEGINQSRTNYQRLLDILSRGISPDYWIIGSDGYTSEIFKLIEYDKMIQAGVNLAVVNRLRYPIADKKRGIDNSEIPLTIEDLEQRVIFFAEPPKYVGITSGIIKDKLREGQDCTGMLPDNVLAYIFQHNLYEAFSALKVQS